MSVTNPAARATPIEGDSRAPSAPNQAAVPSFPELYDRYVNFVWTSARRLGVRAIELDDVVQEIFVVIHGRLATLEQPESLRSWIYSITRRTVSTYHRSRRTKQANAEVFNSDPDMQYSPPPSPLDMAEHSDDVKLLWSLLSKLDATKREVFVLAELEEMTAPEIASAIEIPLNTVYSRLRSARLDVEAALARYRAQTGQRSRP